MVQWLKKKKADELFLKRVFPPGNAQEIYKIVPALPPPPPPKVFLRDDVSNTWWQVYISKSLYKHEIKHLTMCYWKIRFSVQLWCLIQSFLFPVSFTKESLIKGYFLVMGDLFCGGEGVFWCSVCVLRGIINLFSQSYVWIYNKGQENRSASVTISISNVAKTPHLSAPSFYNFLVAACSLFLYLWRSEMNFRKQVFSLPDKYVIISFHMVPDRHFFHFVSIVVDCLLKSCTGKSAFLSLGEWIGNPLVTVKGK